MTLLLFKTNKPGRGEYLQAKMQELGSFPCSDLHVQLAAEGPSQWAAAPGRCAGRAALPPAELGQAASNGLALEMGATSVCKR